MTALIRLFLTTLVFFSTAILDAARFNSDAITPTKIPAAYYDPIDPAKPPLYYDPNNPTSPPAPSEKTDSKAILETIEGQINALQHEDVNGAYFTYTSEAFRGTTSLDEFKYFLNSYPVFENNKNAFFGGPEIRGDNAFLRGTLLDNQGASATVDYYFFREGGRWKILGIKIKDWEAVPPVHEPAAVIKSELLKR